MDSVGRDLESLEGFPAQDINGTTLVDKDPGRHEVWNDNEDNGEVVEVDALEVPVRKGDRRESSLWKCIDKINVNVLDGM